MDERVIEMSHNISQDFFKQMSALWSYPVFVMVIIAFYLTNQNQEALFMILGMIMMYIVAIPLRIIFFKERPDPIPYEGILEKIRASTMPSLHSSRTIFLLLFFLPYFGESFEHRMFLVFLAVLIFYSRIIRKRHFFIDVFIGILIGLLTFYTLSYYFQF